ncbi:hypothetical protein Salat_1143400 [Sesamum alatum]|uniref:Uncharacterized protein n=1 Tax=Sesamum alatum TaxID=300844 RepID=A0AAE1YE53_9LAMI|nr:hypothetical protein Salat_1143400 [Sesamum alatum]
MQTTIGNLNPNPSLARVSSTIDTKLPTPNSSSAAHSSAAYRRPKARRKIKGKEIVIYNSFDALTGVEDDTGIVNSGPKASNPVETSIDSEFRNPCYSPSSSSRPHQLTLLAVVASPARRNPCRNSNRGPQLSDMNVSASISFSITDSTSLVMQSEEETLEQTTNATNEERTIDPEENVEATKDDLWVQSPNRMYTKSRSAATTQLHRHLQSCANYVKAKADKSKDGLLQTQLGFVSSSVDPSACPSLYVGKFDIEKMKESVAHWIMMHEHPFSIVEEEGFNLMQRRGMPE